MTARCPRACTSSAWRATRSGTPASGPGRRGAGRASCYDRVSALRDLVQNHLLQLLSLVAMEPPVHFTADAARNEKAKVLQAITPPSLSTAVRGQYDAGVVGGEPVRGYLEEEGVAPGSETETYAALRLEVDTAQGSIGVRPNQLVLEIQPDEGVSLTLAAKVPGATRAMRVRPVLMQYLYGAICDPIPWADDGAADRAPLRARGPTRGRSPRAAGP